MITFKVSTSMEDLVLYATSLEVGINTDCPAPSLLEPVVQVVTGSGSKSKAKPSHPVEIGVVAAASSHVSSDRADEEDEIVETSV